MAKKHKKHKKADHDASAAQDAETTADDGSSGKLGRKEYEAELARAAGRARRACRSGSRRPAPRCASSSRAATPRGRAARSNGSPNGSAHGCSASSRCRRPPSGRSRRCTSSATSPHFPAAGEVVIFDRSWYNRAGVEPVMGFCTPEQTEKFLEQVPSFEKAMVDSGILLIKYWLEVERRRSRPAGSRAASTTRARSGSCRTWT